MEILIDHNKKFHKNQTFILGNSHENPQNLCLYPLLRSIITCYILLFYQCTHYYCRSITCQENDFLSILCPYRIASDRDMTMADKLMYIPNDDTQNYLFCILQLIVERLDTQLKFNKSLPKFLSQQLEHYYKTLGTSVINSLKSPPSL